MALWFYSGARLSKYVGTAYCLAVAFLCDCYSPTNDLYYLWGISSAVFYTLCVFLLLCTYIIYKNQRLNIFAAFAYAFVSYLLIVIIMKVTQLFDTSA